MKALKVTISGSYRTADKDIVDFHTSGIMPYVGDEELINMHVRRRYAAMWISASEKYKDRVVTVRECFIDRIEEVDADLTFVGKDIIDMTQEEIQDLAAAKDLRGVPLYKKSSTRQMQNVAYAEYSEKVLGKEMDHRTDGFNIAKLPPIIVQDPSWMKDASVKQNNEDILAAEQQPKALSYKKK